MSDSVTDYFGSGWWCGVEDRYTHFRCGPGLGTDGDDSVMVWRVGRCVPGDVFYDFEGLWEWWCNSV